MATPNMPASEWPELEPQEIREIGQVVEDVQYMTEHQDEGPLPTVS